MSVAPQQSSDQASTLTPDQLRFVAERGIEMCRGGDWRRGLEVLAAVAETDHRDGDLPGHFHSYLGYAVARCEHKIPLGLALARRATEKQFFDPENFLNLARVYLLAGNRRKAYGSVVEGLRLDSRHPELHGLLEKLGKRRRPLVGFLSRSNPVNQFLGRARRTLGS